MNAQKTISQEDSVKSELGTHMMTNLEQELDELKKGVLEMISMVGVQLDKCKDATVNTDIDLAEEVVNQDKRINAMELKLNRDCENILALYNPVAIDLRFVLASLKAIHDLERIGDNAQGVAKHLIEIAEKTDKTILQKFGLIKMYEMAITMLDDVYQAMAEENTKLARKIFKKDLYLDERNKKATEVAIKIMKEQPQRSKLVLALFSIARKLERIRDLNKNLGEEIIFHLEAKVLKHKKSKKKKG
jgi:phosphate transport system protein